ncbi:hypothetical protein C1A50_2135 [Paenibacillus polymyxa]|nr:hypothetical protein C1A50_2135 [Paenibacillus polymyxa]
MNKESVKKEFVLFTAGRVTIRDFFFHVIHARTRSEGYH